jgi:hypothetical protein
MTQRMYLDIGGAFPMEVTPPAQLPMTNRQEATVIAALRLWQCALRGKIDLVGTGHHVPDFAALATDMGLHGPLTPDEIDDLLLTVFRTA